MNNDDEPKAQLNVLIPASLRREIQLATPMHGQRLPFVIEALREKLAKIKAKKGAA